MFRFTPLEDWLEDRYRTALTDADIARLIGVPRDAIRKLRRDGLDAFAADVIAVGLGVHPSTIWRDWWRTE
jgi:hypothetical protein